MADDRRRQAGAQADGVAGSVTVDIVVELCMHEDTRSSRGGRGDGMVVAGWNCLQEFAKKGELEELDGIAVAPPVTYGQPEQPARFAFLQLSSLTRVDATIYSPVTVR